MMGQSYGFFLTRQTNVFDKPDGQCQSGVHALCTAVARKRLVETKKSAPRDEERTFLFEESRGCPALSFCLGLYGHHAAVALTTLEGNNAVGEGEERVVAAHADILARIVNRAALANDDVAGDASLTTPDFHAESLRSGLAAVLGTTYTFFMCHCLGVLGVKQ